MIQGQRLAFYRSPVINGGAQIRSGLAVWRSAAQAAASLTYLKKINSAKQLGTKTFINDIMLD